VILWYFSARSGDGHHNKYTEDDDDGDDNDNDNGLFFFILANIRDVRTF